MSQGRRKASPEAYKSRGQKAAQGGNPGKPESHKMPEPHELKKSSKKK